MFVNENVTVQAIISQKNDLSLLLPQRFQNAFAHKSKH